ncbi:MAG: PAS domain-containing sensor histidine kinase [Elusimicrobiales bacterium]|nr:PAS domain-containing sensor histidine kinase [Elusimicrobiales bacterium]
MTEPAERIYIRAIALTASGSVLAIALLCLAAFLLDAPTIGGVFPNGIPMAPATALCFLLLSGVLILWQTGLPWKRQAVRAAAALILLISASVLFRQAHEAMNTTVIPLWKMSPFTAGLFMLSAIALARLARPKAGPDNSFIAACAVQLALSSLILLGYLYGSPFFYGGSVIPVAFPTGLAFMVLSAALFASDPESILATPFYGDSLKAALFRNFLPLVLAAVMMDKFFDLWQPAFFTSKPALDALHALLAMGAAAWLAGRISKRVGDKLALAQQRQLDSERSLAASRNLLRSVIDNTPAFVYMLDTEGRFIAANNSLAGLFGLKPSDFTGKKRNELMPRETAVQHEANDRLVIECGCPRQFEETAFSGEKAERTFFTVKFPLRDESGAVIGIGGVSTDITERKRAERETQKLNLQLAESKQDMENLLHITSHDLRTPLVNIHGFTENLSRDFDELLAALKTAALPEETRAAVSKLADDHIPTALHFITEGVKNMNQVINTLLKVARLGKAEIRPEALDINAILKNVLDSLHYQLKEAGCEVKAGELPPCKADANAMTHIFTNLLSNAIKYRDRKRALEITVRGEKTGAAVRYSVADNGLGIKETDLPRIWQFFYSGPVLGVEKGEGVGLPLIRRMAEKNSGRIWAESKEGTGSTFFLEMPPVEESR